MSKSKITSYLLKLAKTLLLFSLLFVSRGYSEDVAKVDKLIITSQTVDSLSKLIVSAQGGNPSDIPKQNQDYLNRVIVENLIAEELVRLEVKAKKITISKKSLDSAFQNFQEQFGGSNKFQTALKASNQNEAKFKEKLKQELLSQRLLKEFLSEIRPPSELQIKNYFQANKKRFPINDSLRASQIFLSLPKKAPIKEIKSKTKQLKDIRKKIITISRVEERLVEFSKIAVKISEGLYSKQGGDMGFFQKGDFVKEFNKNITSLEVGEVSKVFQTPQGVHLVLLTTKNDGKYPSYRLSIIQTIIENQSAKNQTQLGKYIQTLAKKYNVQILNSNYATPNAGDLPFK